MPSFKFVLPLMAAMLLATPAIAQSGAPAMPVQQDNGQLVLEAQGQRFAIPMPDWIDAAAPNWAELVSPRFSDVGNQAHLEIYPRGEGEAFWSTHYGARVTQLPNPALADFRAVVMDVYARTCRPDAIAFFQLEADDGDNIPPLGFVCGAYADPQMAREGEITIMAFFKSETGVSMLYQGWRGTAFDAARTETWPVTPQAVETHVARFKTEPVLSRAD